MFDALILGLTGLMCQEEKIMRRAENMRKAREFEERWEREKEAIMAQRAKEREDAH